MVVTGLSPIALTGNTHERTARPSRWTVQAPHWATPHPNLVPVRPTISRNTHNSGMSAGTSTERRSPLTFNTYMSDSGRLAAPICASLSRPAWRVGRGLVMVIDVQTGQPLRRDAPTAVLAHVALVIVAVAGVPGIAHFRP